MTHSFHDVSNITSCILFRLHGQVTAELKAKMMYEGTLMIGYQPLGQTPNFFRSIISNSAVQKQDIDFMLSELDRLGANL